MTEATEAASPTLLILGTQPALYHVELDLPFRQGLTHVASSSIPSNALWMIVKCEQFYTGKRDRCIPRFATMPLLEKLLHFRNHHCNFCHPFIAFIEDMLFFKYSRSDVKVTEWSVQCV